MVRMSRRRTQFRGHSGVASPMPSTAQCPPPLREPTRSPSADVEDAEDVRPWARGDLQTAADHTTCPRPNALGLATSTAWAHRAARLPLPRSRAPPRPLSRARRTQRRTQADASGAPRRSGPTERAPAHPERRHSIHRALAALELPSSTHWSPTAARRSAGPRPMTASPHTSLPGPGWH